MSQEDYETFITNITDISNITSENDTIFEKPCDGLEIPKAEELFRREYLFILLLWNLFHCFSSPRYLIA